MAIIVTLRLMDDRRENRAERKIAGKHPKRTLFSFFLLMRENFMSLSYSSSFFF